MPHEFAGVFHALLHHSRGFGHNNLEAADAVSHKLLGGCGFRPDKVQASGNRRGHLCTLPPTTVPQTDQDAETHWARSLPEV